MENEDFVLTNGAATSNSGAPQVQSDYNLFLKRCFMGENISTQGKLAIDKAPEQPSVAITYPRKESIPYKPRETKAMVSSLLDVLEQLKKAPANISVWDLLSIPEQNNWLKEALSKVGKTSGKNVTKAPQISEERFQPSAERSFSPTMLTNQAIPPKSQMEGQWILKSFRLEFAYSNNEAKYKGLIQGLSLAEKMGTKQLKVLGDSELIVHQVRGISSAKHVHKRSYRHRTWDLIESFDAFNIQSIPRKTNAFVDQMATIGS
ncbi:uncharacterized protein LOC131860415 [Cryptomeria japonica]|uniref:uncharacterized protein LOC131860415 n=1 Tax=Cryptomeria japonica TaxID=3369 RepID=UPI0027DA9881|nr:uncharacterized protein LOC131860415 [Cryptomeria japonica]